MERSEVREDGTMKEAPAVEGNRVSFIGQLRYLIVSLRPPQWLKNLFVFAGLIFGGRLAVLHDSMTALLGFVAFSAISSSVYLYNDLIDIERDRKHPV